MSNASERRALPSQPLRREFGVGNGTRGLFCRVDLRHYDAAEGRLVSCDRLRRSGLD